MNTNLLSQVHNPLTMAQGSALGQGNLLGQGNVFGQDSTFNKDSALNQDARFRQANVEPQNSDKFRQLNNYNDLNSLQSLNHISKTDKEGALDAAAKHFESIFVSMMIKGMRDANKAFSEGNMLQSNESDFYQQMFDSQLAVSLATGKGIGLADVIKRQLSKEASPNLTIEAGGLPLDGTGQKKYGLEDYARQPFVSPLKVSEIQNAVDKIDQTLESLPLDKLAKVDLPQASRQALTEDAALDFTSPEKFIESLYPYAKSVERETGIDARLMLAQSALETGWGQHQINKGDGTPSFNLFGIKAQQGWDGDAAEILTTEYRGGLAMKERASFRAYDSYSDSFKDYANFLKSNDRYQNALEHTDNPKEFAYALQDSGYATDPDYANKINRIMDRYIGLDAVSDLGDEGFQSDESAQRQLTGGGE